MIQVFRGETVETVDSELLRVRIAWATRKVRRIVAERRGGDGLTRELVRPHRGGHGWRVAT